MAIAILNLTLVDLILATRVFIFILLCNNLTLAHLIPANRKVLIWAGLFLVVAVVVSWCWLCPLTVHVHQLFVMLVHAVARFALFALVVSCSVGSFGLLCGQAAATALGV